MNFSILLVNTYVIMKAKILYLKGGDQTYLWDRLMKNQILMDEYTVRNFESYHIKEEISH